MIINPALRPLSEATYDDGPIILYSASPSPMWNPQIGASIELGWVGNGTTPGVHTARFGFFPFEAGDSFGWTHFFRPPIFNVDPEK